MSRKFYFGVVFLKVTVVNYAVFFDFNYLVGAAHLTLESDFKGLVLSFALRTLYYVHRWAFLKKTVLDGRLPLVQFYQKSQF